MSDPTPEPRTPLRSVEWEYLFAQVFTTVAVTALLLLLILDPWRI